MPYTTVKSQHNRSNFCHIVKNEYSISRSHLTVFILITDQKNQVTLPPTSYVFHTPLALLPQILSVSVEFAVDFGSGWSLRQAPVFCL